MHLGYRLKVYISSKNGHCLILLKQMHKLLNELLNIDLNLSLYHF